MRGFDEADDLVGGGQMDGRPTRRWRACPAGRVVGDPVPGDALLERAVQHGVDVAHGVRRKRSTVDCAAGEQLAVPGVELVGAEVDDLNVAERRYYPPVDQPSVLTCNRRRKVRRAVRPPLVTQLANRAEGRRCRRVRDLGDERDESSLCGVAVSAHRPRYIGRFASGRVSTGVHP